MDDLLPSFCLERRNDHVKWPKFGKKYEWATDDDNLPQSAHIPERGGTRRWELVRNIIIDIALTINQIMNLYLTYLIFSKAVGVGRRNGDMRERWWWWKVPNDFQMEPCRNGIPNKEMPLIRYLFSNSESQRTSTSIKKQA